MTSTTFSHTPRMTERVRFLSADITLHANLNNALFSMCQAEHIAKVLEIDQPWEKEGGFRLGYVASVLVDEQKRLRMYYELIKSNAQRCCSVAFSDDGIAWNKPKLDLTSQKYVIKDNNIINLVDTMWLRGPCVFQHPNEPATQCYMMSWRKGRTMHTAVSADGLNFHNVGVVTTQGNLDSLNVSFFNPITNKYTVYTRWWLNEGLKEVPPKRRGIATKSSEKWEGTWSGKRQIVIDPVDIPGEDGWMDIYTSSIQPYYGQYIGLPACWYREPLPDYSRTSGALYPTFMHSLNGKSWTFPSSRHPIIRLNAHGQDTTNFGMAFPATKMLERKGYLWIYYLYQVKQHHQPPPREESIHLAKLRIDGFGVIRAEPGKEGIWTTPVLHLSDNVKSLCLNLQATGWVRVEILDSKTDSPIPGFEFDNCLPIRGDELSAIVTWKDAKLNQLTNSDIRLRFHFFDAGIYSFWFMTI